MKNSTILLRILIALSVGIVVAAISVRSVWLEARRSPAFTWEQRLTHDRMETIGLAMAEYQKKHDKLPASLEELLDVRPDLSDETDGFRDYWGRPLIYSIEGSGYSLVSLGRDGKPGGTGLDWDISSADPNPWILVPTSPEAQLRLGEFLFERPTWRMVGTCLLGGLLAGLFTFGWVRSPQLSAGVVVAVVSTIVGAAVVSVFIAALHIPTGH
jgi:general secretion pathway protein G